MVAINAGNANCAAGQAGLDAARATCAAAAKAFGCRTEEVFPSSTGIIGVPLPAGKLIRALPAAQAALGGESDHFLAAAQAILTTDTVEKTAFARFEGNGGEVRIAAFCKGAGMILSAAGAARHHVGVRADRCRSRAGRAPGVPE